jgi:hypothetical protein
MATLDVPNWVRMFVNYHKLCSLNTNAAKTFTHY